MTEKANFVPVKYLIDWSTMIARDSMAVEGFAFETPGWPEFHACVRYNHCGSVFDMGWVVDHFESGLRVVQVKTLHRMEDAPAALQKVLDNFGRKRVTKAIGRYL